MSQHRFLVVQLADIGDLILSTPALLALREAHPEAHISLLTTPHAAPVIDENLVDELIAFDKEAFTPRGLMGNFREIFGLIQRLRQGNYDTTILLHHFTLRLGVYKFRLIVRTAGSARVVGLDNGRVNFLTHTIPDDGFGAKHEAQYRLELVGLVGANSAPRPAQVNIDNAYDVPNSRLPAKKRVIIHAGSGGYSLARRWSPQEFARVADGTAA